jgi:excisionase family DNA binding protein
MSQAADDFEDVGWFKVAYVAKALSVTTQTVRAWLNNGQMEGIKLPAPKGGEGEWRVSKDELQKFIDKAYGRAARE